MNAEELQPVIRIERDSVRYGIAHNYYTGVNIPPNVSIIDDKKVKQLIKDKILPEYATISQTFIKSPYSEKKYILQNEYEIDTINEKVHHIDTLAGMLGATYSKRELHIDVCNRRSLDAKVSGKIQQWQTNISSSADYKESFENKITHSILVDKIYNGIALTKEIYDRAYDYANTHNLMDDTCVKDLLRFRNPAPGTNLLEKFESTTQLCQELNRNIDFAAKLCAMEGAIDIDVDFIKSVFFKMEASLRFKFEFIKQ